MVLREDLKDDFKRYTSGLSEESLRKIIKTEILNEYNGVAYSYVKAIIADSGIIDEIVDSINRKQLNR